MGVAFSALFSRRPEGEDRLSELPDDVLVSILERVDDLRTAVRTSALSKRWSRLPWLLPDLTLDADDFISASHLSKKPNEPIEAKVIHDAMLTLTAETKSFFAKPRTRTRTRRESTVTRLCLELYLVDPFLCDIGPLVCDAIDHGLLKDLDLAILDEEACWQRSQTDVIKRAQDVDGFFRAYPSVFHCLTKLSLWSVSFVELDIHHILFDCCKQLEHLALTFCHVDPHFSSWKIDAPNSKLRVLQLEMCLFERIELISLPKLEKLTWLVWKSESAPLSFGFVPSLEELGLSNFMPRDWNLMKLSEVLNGGVCIHTLALDFNGYAIWLQREIKQLASAFRELSTLSILGIFIEFDLLWITTFLEAAPSIEMMHIEVCEHTCWLGDLDGENGKYVRTNPQWELVRGSKNLLLREVHIWHFRPVEQQLAFIRAILERAPNLQTLVLNKDGQECDYCDAMGLDTPPVTSARPLFPVNKEEQDMVVRQVTDVTSFSGQIIFQ